MGLRFFNLAAGALPYRAQVAYLKGPARCLLSGRGSAISCQFSDWEMHGAAANDCRNVKPFYSDAIFLRIVFYMKCYCNKGLFSKKLLMFMLLMHII